MAKPVVLLADDNDATCTLITALLRHEFVVEVASDGREAIEKLRSREYEVVLLDLLMPIVDGYAVLDFITAEHPDLLSRVLIVTAALAPRELDRIEGYAVGGVIRKPFEVDSFLDAVRTCTAADGRARGSTHHEIYGG